MGQEGGDLILISGLLLLRQISLLKPKITQCWVSLQYKDDLAGVRALPRLMLPSSSVLLQTALSLFHPSVAIFSDVDFPFLESYFKFSIQKGFSGPPSKACLTKGFKSHRNNSFPFPPKRCLSVLL